MIVFIAAQIKSRACVVSLSDMYAHRVAGQHLCHEFFFPFIKIQQKIKNFLEFLFVPVEILKILPVSTQVPISFGVQVENFRIENIKLVEDSEEENPILVKEIEKLYRKHHRLMGYEKKTKVVQSLMRKGFSYDDISTVYERICEELEDE